MSVTNIDTILANDIIKFIQTNKLYIDFDYESIKYVLTLIDGNVEYDRYKLIDDIINIADYDYYDYKVSLRENILETFDISPELADEIDEYIDDYYELDIDFDSVFNTTVNVNLFINIDKPISRKSVDKKYNNRIKWLNYYFKSQNIDVSKYKKIINKLARANYRNIVRNKLDDHDLLKSLPSPICSYIIEVSESCFDCNNLVILLKMTLSEFFEIRKRLWNKTKTKNSVSITLHPYTTVGFFDRHSGAAGALDLDISNGFTISNNNFYFEQIQIERNGKNFDQECTVDGVCGLVDSAWKFADKIEFN